MSRQHPKRHRNPNQTREYTSIHTRKKPVPFPLEMVELVEAAKYYKPPYDDLFRVLYLFGLRISEALLLKPTDFKHREHEEEEYLICNTITEKNRQQPFRVLTALQTYEDKQMVEEVNMFLENVEPGKRLFTNVPSRFAAAWHFRQQEVDVQAIDYKSKQMMYLEGFKLHPHYLRHCRLTHLVTEYDYDVVQLTQFAGWTDFTPAMIYLQLNWRNLIK